MERINLTLDFALARAKHLEWKSRLRDFLDGKAGLTEAQATSHKDCDLGRWLYSEGLKKYGESSAMRELEQVHAELHAIVKRVVQTKKAGDAAGAQQEFKKIGPVSTQIVNLLRDIEKQLQA